MRETYEKRSLVQNPTIETIAHPPFIWIKAPIWHCNPVNGKILRNGWLMKQSSIVVVKNE